MKSHSQVRRGFTLVELLVVMALIAILASLAIMFFPTVASSQVEARAGTQLQSWLTIAKQRALRDQAPRGLRLWITTAPAGASTLLNVVTDCQNIEQPPDFPGNASVTIMTGSPTNPAALNAVMFMPAGSGASAAPGTGIIVNGYVPLNAAQTEYWTVQPGDYLEILGTGLMHEITQIGVADASGNVNADYVVISPPLPYAVSTTANFRVVRAPRVTGDETLKMPDNTLIDLSTNTNAALFGPYTNPLPVPNAVAAADNGAPNGFIDILFSPSGEVISSGVASSNINLWVRSPNVDFPNDPFRGAPTLISVFTKTGFVGAYPPNPTIIAPATFPNPYLLVK